MKILHLHTELNLACGITRTISQIIKNSSSEYEHNLIALGGNGLCRFESFNFKPIILQVNKPGIVNKIKTLFFLSNYCRDNSIQIIHSHHRYFDTLVWFLKPITKIKTVTSAQSKVYNKRIFSYKADKLIACSKTIKNHLINNFNIDEKRIEVIYNAVNSASTKLVTGKAQLKKELNIGLEDFVIGFVGRIDFAEKGVDVLLDAFNKLSKLNLNIHLLMIGDGPNYLEVQRYCELNKGKAILLSSKENIFDYYNLMDLVVLPSRIDPFPLAMLEAGLMQKTFIGGNVDGIAELIGHDKEGLLFESGQSVDLKRQILRILEDKKLADTLAENLTKKVLASYTVKKIIPQYEELYKSILSGINENY